MQTRSVSFCRRTSNYIILLLVSESENKYYVRNTTLIELVMVCPDFNLGVDEGILFQSPTHPRRHRIGDRVTAGTCVRYLQPCYRRTGEATQRVTLRFDSRDDYPSIRSDSLDVRWHSGGSRGTSNAVHSLP